MYHPGSISMSYRWRGNLSALSVFPQVATLAVMCSWRWWKRVVDKLKCKVCVNFRNQIRGNYVQECDSIDVKARVTVAAVPIAEKRGTTSTTTQQQTAEDSAGTAEPSQPPSKKRRLADILKKPSSSEPETPHQMVEKEVDRYLQSLRPELDTTKPLEWWKTHSEHYPNLSILARKYLCVCATSVMSERLFSTSGYVVSDRRSCLKPHRVNMLFFFG